jgi:NAD+ kinase
MLAPVSYSPDVDVFTTPPTTPMTSEPPNESIIRPSLSRSISRPSSLNISNTTGEFKPDIFLESQSPPSVPSDKSSAPVTTPRLVLTAESDRNGHQNGQPKPPSDSSDLNSRLASSTTTTTDSALINRALLTQEPSTLASIPRSHTHSHSPMMSPCFVHSNLDKGASFSEWLTTSNGFPSRIDIAPILRPMAAAEWPQAPPRRYRTLDNGQVIPIPYEDDKVENVFDASDYDYEDDDGSASLTKQLADTAVGVREMSKQLGASLQTRSPLPKALNNCTQAARVSDPIFRMC